MGNVSTPSRKTATPVAKAATPVAATERIAESNFDPAHGRPVFRKDSVDPASPLFIELQVLPRQPYFAADHNEVARNTGFSLCKNGGGLALADVDTGIGIAYVRWNGFTAAVGELKAIAIHCDPERCPVELQAGGRLVGTLTDFSQQLDGYIADGLGRELAAAEIAAIGEHIDSIMRRRWDEIHEVGVPIDANTVRFRGALPFQFYDQVLAPRKRIPEMRGHFFPAHRANYYAGRAEGAIRALQLIDFNLNHKIKRPAFAAMLEEIFKSGQWDDLGFNNGSGHAASEFVEIIEAVFQLGCSVVSKGWLLGRVQRWERTAAEWDEHQAASRADFVERMRAARAAKKTAREGGAG
ncbi:hypothetical protein EJP67_16460 [Variovorax guangxiensis]|uniref:Uncharacterized protein n=1 Tax=Variovorax guangxiensis TaxID=1775474 RepID=A0A3S0XSW3_9BURK|nr:hypothetical protein [Variovorax guangxiensis]RUR68656.1 hypothetical protein EJP67_16460 [Variovorax guangxiensis]